MKFQKGGYVVVRYREFYDFPRLMLAKDDLAGYWIFDCPFDDSIDDYRGCFSVFYAGDSLASAEEAFSKYALPSDSPAEFEIAVADLEFDPSRRSSFVLR